MVLTKIPLLHLMLSIISQHMDLTIIIWLMKIEAFFGKLISRKRFHQIELHLELIIFTKLFIARKSTNNSLRNQVDY